MKIITLTSIFFITLLSTVIGSIASAHPLVDAARERLTHQVRYDGAYMRLSYPGGDVPDGQGVCSDVVIRSLRTAYNFDLQQSVHEDMQSSFSRYPKIWGLTRTDKNIDHRRVPNLETFFKRQDMAVPVTQNPQDYKPGDLVSWRLPGHLPHIGIVSDQQSRAGTPLIIHNIGAGPQENDILFAYDINGHFRFVPHTD